ncbi:MAG: queuosine precursor transporter [DPANN group archaeon]|nr:queuosine precursor transporter [DPANN group archaeon]
MNEILFFVFIFIDLFLALLFLRFFGKRGVMVFYVAHIIMSQITVKMQINLFGFTTIFGSMLFAVLFLCTDIITEHFGKKEGYRTVTLGVASLLFFIFVIQAATIFVPSETNTVFDSFKNLFSNQWRVVFADIIISYLILQKFDVWLFHKINEWTKGKHLWLRNNLSTWTSQTLTAIFFFQAAFFGIIPQAILWQIILTGLAMKLLIALLDTPFVYLSYKFLPKKK